MTYRLERGAINGQHFKADIIDSAVRNSFVSGISCRARREVTRIMSGSNEFGKLAETLIPGQAVWMTPRETWPPPNPI